MKDLPVSKVMTSPLVTVGPDEPLSSALTLMEQQRVHHLLVVEQGRMAGILSSADLLEVALLRRPEEARSTQSHYHRSTAGRTRSLDDVPDA